MSLTPFELDAERCGRGLLLSLSKLSVLLEIMCGGNMLSGLLVAQHFLLRIFPQFFIPPDIQILANCERIS